MAGVKVVRHQLTQSPALVAVVPAEQIVGGRLPEGMQLPAISVTSVSGMRGADVAQGASRQRRERVQVTVVSSSYPEQKEVFQLLVDALPTARGAIAGVEVDSILPVLEGPDFGNDDAGLYMQSYDVMVTYSL